MTDKEKDYYANYNYNDRKPVYIKENELTELQKHRLMDSDVFCIIPWISMHGQPGGKAYPCCLSEVNYPIGDLNKETMEEAWNSDVYKNMRKNMLEEKPCKECTRCYEQEASGFVSMRNSLNKNFGQHVALAEATKPNGHVDEFKLRYYDVRFSNLCNMSCRTCGSMFSSSWYGEDVKMYGKSDYPQFMYAGRTETDMWEQMLPHIPYIEQIYFAGGEPLIMEEHYNILKELVRQERFDVRLIYNTNFSRLNLKNENVLDYWNLFKNVSVGASLDGMGERAEYIRKGTKWDEIERNREQMIKRSPNTDFYVSSTVSLYNVDHISDFHRDWVGKGLLKPQDWNINILQFSERDRIDVLPKVYKDKITEKILNHIYWLGPKDHLKRATTGYKSLLTFMNGDDKSHLLKEFFRVNDLMDVHRQERFVKVFPEYADLRSYVNAA
jgi:radical SAM protein with 4Fe4S-binding SPASM domain